MAKWRNSTRRPRKLRRAPSGRALCIWPTSSRRKPVLATMTSHPTKDGSPQQRTRYISIRRHWTRWSKALWQYCRSAATESICISYLCSKAAKWPFPLGCFRLCVPFSEGGFSSVGHLDPLAVGRGLGVVVVVPVPPLVRWGLGITLWRVLPSLLAAERRDIEVAPGGPHRLVAAVVDEVCAKHTLSVAEEHVVAVPFVDAEVGVEAVGDGVPGHLPAHPRLQASDVGLRRA